MAFASLIEQGLDCRLSAYYRIDKSWFDECLDGLPAYTNCLICCIDKSTGIPDSLYFVPQGEIFHNAWLQGFLYKPFYFDLVFFDASIENVPFFGVPSIAAFQVNFDDKMLSFISLLSHEERNALLFKDHIVSATLEKISIFILRDLHQRRDKIFDHINDHFNNERLMKILSFMHQNIGDDLTLENISGLIFLSPDYVGQFFKKSVGNSLWNYVIEQRIKLGLNKLVSTSKQIAAISDMTGFTDQAYFNRQFKSLFGVNPLKVRKKYQLLNVSKAGARLMM